MKQKNRQAFLCCNMKRKSFYKELWNERMGECIVQTPNIEDASELYVIDEKNIPQDEKIFYVEKARQLGLRVHYLNQELINEEITNNVLEDKCISKQKTKLKEMEL